jgi:murein tripeptide amidase MpaA
MWHFPDFFDSAAPIANSVDACDYEVYIGPGELSEPETRNVVWLLDQHPTIRFFVDLHSFGRDILYTWGDDQDQTTKPAMNFQNPAFNGKRGVANDTAYREFIASSDRVTAVGLANRMRDAIKAVRGTRYTTKQAFALYPTAGTSDDYAYSRHLTDPAKPKIYAFTIEWGRTFHPPYAEMTNIITEVTAGLVEFALAVLDTPT